MTADSIDAVTDQHPVVVAGYSEEQDALGTLPYRCLTPVEVAQLLGIGRSTVYELLASGDLPSVRVGRTRRVPLRCVEQYVENRLAESQDC